MSSVSAQSGCLNNDWAELISSYFKLIYNAGNSLYSLVNEEANMLAFEV